MSKKFYKMRLIAEEYGLIVHTDIFHSVRETNCYYMCVPEYEFRLGLIPKKYKYKRIAKGSDRFASETPEKALEKLKWLKRKQLKHMEREAIFINKFLECEQFEDHGNYSFEIPGTIDLVRQYFVF